MLAVNEKHLIEVAQRRVAAEQHTAERIASVKKLFAEDKMTAMQLQEAKRLLQASVEALSETDKQRRQVYVDLADNKLTAAYLTAALAAIKSADSSLAKPSEPVTVKSAGTSGDKSVRVARSGLEGRRYMDEQRRR